MEHTAAQSNPVVDRPLELGGYRLVQELTEGHCFRAIAPGERAVVLKMLEPDLIVRGQLHPNVRDRLSRVREIAHIGVANLYGAERDNGQAYLVWEYVAGHSLAEWYGMADRSPRELLLIARELVLAVESLHARGIVHGAIHPRNVIIADNGRVRLTHISPYLYTDPQADADAVTETLREMVADSQTGQAAMAPVLPLAEQPAESLRSLGTRLTAQLEMRQQPAMEHTEVQAERRQRHRSLVGAMGVLLAGMLSALVLHRAIGSTSMASPVPPEAPARLVR